MISMSQRWAATITGSHTMTSTASVLYAGAPVLDGLQVVGGSVTADRTAAQLTRSTIELAEPALVPGGDADVFAPVGFEVVVSRGVVHFDGTTELVQLGVFPIQRSTINGDTLLTSITAVDRSQLVADAKLEDAWPIDAGTNFAVAIRTMIDAAVPGLEYAFATTDLETPRLVIPAFADRWEFGRKMAASCGMELLFDGFGRVVLRPEPDIRTISPVWSLVEGDGGTLTAISVDRDRGPTFNRVIAIGQNSTNPEQYRAVATDTDPASPTYYYGGFGRKPTEFRSSLIGSQDQAAIAAEAKLISQLGVGRQVTAAAVPNPALEAGDPILLRRTALGINEVHIADVVVTGLGPADVQTFQTRARQELVT